MRSRPCGRSSPHGSCPHCKKLNADGHAENCGRGTIPTQGFSSSYLAWRTLSSLQAPCHQYLSTRSTSDSFRSGNCDAHHGPALTDRRGDRGATRVCRATRTEHPVTRRLRLRLHRPCGRDVGRQSTKTARTIYAGTTLGALCLCKHGPTGRAARVALESACQTTTSWYHGVNDSVSIAHSRRAHRNRVRGDGDGWRSHVRDGENNGVACCDSGNHGEFAI